MPYNIQAVSGSFAYEPLIGKYGFCSRVCAQHFQYNKTEQNKTKKKRQHSIECKAQHYNKWKWQRRQKGHRNGDNKMKLFSQFPYAFESIANNKMNEWMNEWQKKCRATYPKCKWISSHSFLTWKFIIWIVFSALDFVHFLAQKHSHDVIIIFMLEFFFFRAINGKQPHQTYQSKC